MKEIDIAKILAGKRKEKGVTQYELANYIGVSKASVSKWETGQSYPDIALLPRLASYFNISIDDLIGYRPQVRREDIRRLYHRLSSEFASRPFDEVMSHCREIIKKHFSCFPLLLQMGVLILNHSKLPKNADKSALLISEARELFVRVRKESNDIDLTRQALYMEASCCVTAGDADAALELLEGASLSASPVETLLAAAYHMAGKNEDAKATLQVGIYQHIVSLFTIFPSYLALCANEPERHEEALRRALAMAETLDLKRLYPQILLNLYISAAEGYVAQGKADEALNMLQKYAELSASCVYPLNLHGDAFFDLVDSWLAETDLGTAPPLDEKTVRTNMADMVAENPAFAVFAEERRFQNIVSRLRNCVWGLST